MKSDPPKQHENDASKGSLAEECRWKRGLERRLEKLKNPFGRQSFLDLFTMSGKRFESAEDLIAKGNSAFVDELFDDALEAYNAALELEDDNHEAFLKRAAAHYALKNFAGAFRRRIFALQMVC